MAQSLLPPSITIIAEPSGSLDDLRGVAWEVQAANLTATSAYYTIVPACTSSWALVEVERSHGYSNGFQSQINFDVSTELLNWFHDCTLSFSI